MFRSNLKGSRKLQFIGGTVSGNAGGGGTVTGTGSAQTADDSDEPMATALATSGGMFNTTSLSSGFVTTNTGTAMGKAAGGGTGSQDGKANIALGGVGTLGFTGTTASSGKGDFVGGFSPVFFNSVTTETPGATTSTFVPKVSGKNGKKAYTLISTLPSTFNTVVTPISTGATGGAGNGSGSQSITSIATGSLLTGVTGMSMVMDPPLIVKGDGSSGGKATNFGEGSASGRNYFGIGGGAANGTGTIAAFGSGSTMNDSTNGSFNSTGQADGSFSNTGSGIFGVVPPPPPVPLSPKQAFLANIGFP
jgi:hypothetical protein